MTTGTERWESYEYNKTGQFRKDCSVCEKRIAEKGNKAKGERVETTAVVQGVGSLASFGSRCVTSPCHANAWPRLLFGSRETG